MRDSQALLAAMTLEEKASLCSGADMWHTKAFERLEIPPIMLTDGPHGLRKQENVDDALGVSVPAVCFPTASALAASWNRDLVHDIGAALGEACKQEGVSVILGPGCNLKRSPLCGRNFEYFSEDPFLSGQMAASHIRGVQSKGIGACVKHFAVNNQETRRMSIDAVVDERALHELYLTGFEIAVREGKPWTVMGAYNQVNGTFCCEHPYLLTSVLRGSWSYQGVVLTDWGAMNQREDALKAGCDLEMPGPRRGNDTRIVEAVQRGSLDKAVLDRAVERLLQLIKTSVENLDPGFHYDPESHHALARRAAAEGAVLLKNEGSLLPLTKESSIAILGRFAKEPRYQGAGSSYINPTRLDNAWDHMRQLAGDAALTYGAGYSPRGDVPDAELICEAMELAHEADIAVVFAGLTDWYEVEGLDREHMRLPPGHDALIEAVAASNPNTVVVLSNGAPVEMPWEENVPAILEGYLGGQAGGSAIAAILFGDINPSGKLSETFSRHLKDHPSQAQFPGGPKTVEYRESLYVGYRFFDSADMDVRFPFGHGLSYTHFTYHDLQCRPHPDIHANAVRVTFRLRNAGDRYGAEVPQVYVRDVDSSLFRPHKELKGFEKVWLEPGEEKQVIIDLNRRAFAYFNPARSTWEVEAGQFEILVGSSSRDIRLNGFVVLPGDAENTPPQAASATYHHPPEDGRFPRNDFAGLYGRPLPSATYTADEAYTLNTSLQDMQTTFIGRLIARMMKRRMDEMVENDPESPNTMLMQAILREAPLRTFMMAGEGITYDLLEALTLMVNGKFMRGLIELRRAKRRAKQT